MAATPPRSSSPPNPPRPVRPTHSLQISPNLEALLQHDELTRRNSSSPTSAYHPSPSSEFSISLPPPPPRKAKGGQQPTRSKRSQRRKSAVIASDFWPDALPPDPNAAGQSTPTSYSRPVTPNPYLNPTPVLNPDPDQVPTPRLTDKPLQSDTSQPAPETRGRVSTSDPSHRPSNAFHKVEKIFWMGRDSLSLFSAPASAIKRDSDRRDDHTESGDLDAVQGIPDLVHNVSLAQCPNPPDNQIRQVPVALSRPASRFGDSDTATVTLSSKSATSCLHAIQHSEPSQIPWYPNNTSESDPYSNPSPAHRLPRLSLPSIFMSHNSSQRPQSNDSVTGNDYLSFIDFFSPSTSDESNLCHIQDNAHKISPPRRQPSSISIPPASLYSTSHRNLSSTTLASMKFAPPSPPLTVRQRSQTNASSTTCSSSVTLSTMIFAPPSPSTESIPTQPQPLSGPSSPYSPLEFAPPQSPLHYTTHEPRPPTAPEPIADRGRKFKSKKRSKSSSPHHIHASASPLPPTTNQLDASERADRIRRNRKLARVFGRMPGTEEPLTDSDEPRTSKKIHSPSLAALLIKQKNHRHAVSVSVSLRDPSAKTEPLTPWQLDEPWSPGGRRHSTPLATGFTLYVDGEQGGTAAKDPPRSRRVLDSPETASTRSFIDLSDEEVPDDDVSDISCLTLQNKPRGLEHSNSTPSLVESLDSETRVEIERRRKREKLARLHRFLGSRVPPEAVTGSVFGPPLPPPAPLPEESNRERWLRGNKNTPQGKFDRGKDELDEREKALNVRRAQKMERVFGTPPPQVLFHTRPHRPAAPISQPASPADPNPFVLTLDLPSSPRNPNQSAYTGKTIHRQGPSDSSRCLLPGQEDPQSSPSSFAQSFADSFTESSLGFQQVLAQSSVYLNYQHSLNSLVDIIDRDDRKSLIELHRFLHGEADGSSSSEEEFRVNPRRISNATSLRSERRHSLPSSASITSLSSEFFASPQTSRFQIRRRKAAKLTNFFGVDYRELIQDILESIEKGVEDECKHGGLQPQEVEVLMHRVRNLRTMKDPISF